MLRRKTPRALGQAQRAKLSFGERQLLEADEKKLQKLLQQAAAGGGQQHTAKVARAMKRVLQSEALVDPALLRRARAMLSEDERRNALALEAK
eukprot:COSAG01_NODE_14286_length_1472_cov_4.306811_2_plen_93_part_00